MQNKNVQTTTFSFCFAPEVILYSTCHVQNVGSWKACVHPPFLKIHFAQNKRKDKRKSVQTIFCHFWETPISPFYSSFCSPHSETIDLPAKITTKPLSPNMCKKSKPVKSQRPYDELSTLCSWFYYPCTVWNVKRLIFESRSSFLPNVVEDSPLAFATQCGQEGKLHAKLSKIESSLTLPVCFLHSSHFREIFPGRSWTIRTEVTFCHGAQCHSQTFPLYNRVVENLYNGDDTKSDTLTTVTLFNPFWKIIHLTLTLHTCLWSILLLVTKTKFCFWYLWQAYSSCVANKNDICGDKTSADNPSSRRLPTMHLGASNGYSKSTTNHKQTTLSQIFNLSQAARTETLRR